MPWVDATQLKNGDLSTPDPSHSWLPSGWIFTESNSHWLYAQLESDGTSGIETFEGGWGSNEDVISAFVISTNLTLADFDAGTPEAIEDFEEEWGDNENTITDLTPTNANFDSGTPEEFEDFEEEWSSNEDVISAFVISTNLTLADFDAGTPEAIEDFEEEWDNSTIASFSVGVNLTIATFCGYAYESFEEKRGVLSMGTTPGDYSTEQEHDPTRPFWFEGYGTWVGTFTLQCQRSTGGSWIDIFDFDKDGEIEVPAGYRKLRTKCVAYTSGTPASQTHFERLNIY